MSILEINKPVPQHTYKFVKPDRLKSPRSIEKDAIWTKLNHRANGGLKLYNNNDTIKFKVTALIVFFLNYRYFIKNMVELISFYKNFRYHLPQHLRNIVFLVVKNKLSVSHGVPQGSKISFINMSSCHFCPEIDGLNT